MPESALASSAPDSLDVAIATEAALLLREFTQRLKEENDRLLFELWLKGFTYRRIAMVMQSRGLLISHVTVLYRLKTIQKQLISFLG